MKIPEMLDHWTRRTKMLAPALLELQVRTQIIVFSKNLFSIYSACGDVMKLQIRVDDDGKIIDAKFKTFGCGSAIASSSLATEWVKGKTLDQAGALKNTDIAKELCLPPVKLHCSSK